jgi:hypothetical protein
MKSSDRNLFDECLKQTLFIVKVAVDGLLGNPCLDRYSIHARPRIAIPKKDLHRSLQYFVLFRITGLIAIQKDTFERIHEVEIKT